MEDADKGMKEALGIKDYERRADPSSSEICKIKNFFLGIISGLSYLHQKGFVVGHLNPEMIAAHCSGPNITPKIIPFRYLKVAVALKKRS